jgi:hypothetical protein
MAEKITKQEAVRRALAHFGNDAKPSQMQGWIKDELGIEMGADHISTAKGDILRKKGVKGKRAAKKRPKAAKKAVAQPAAATPGTRPAAIPLEDILYIKRLVGRVGPDSLHTLIDAFAN